MIREDQLTRICSDFEIKTGARISDYARQFILNTINAIELDPSPRWIVEKNNLQNISEQLKHELLGYLIDAQKSSGTNYLGYFELLHWLARNLEFRGWPIEKP